MAISHRGATWTLALLLTTSLAGGQLLGGGAQGAAGPLGFAQRWKPLQPAAGALDQPVREGADAAPAPGPAGELHAAVEAVGQMEEQLWAVADNFVHLLFPEEEALAFEAGRLERIVAPGRGLLATAPTPSSPAPATATLDSVMAKMQLAARDVLLAEIQEAIHSTANGIKAALGMNTTSTANATAAAVNAASDAVSALLLTSVQDALKPPTPVAASASAGAAGLAAYPRLSGLMGAANKAASTAAGNAARASSSVSAALTSGTQLFASALNTINSVASVATAAVNAATASLNAGANTTAPAGASPSPAASSPAPAAAPSPGPAAAPAPMSDAVAAAGAAAAQPAVASVYPMLSAFLSASGQAGNMTSLLGVLPQLSPALMTQAVQMLQQNPALAAQAMQALQSFLASTGVQNPGVGQQLQGVLDAIAQRPGDISATLSSANITQLLSTLTTASAASGALAGRRRLLQLAPTSDLPARYRELKDHWYQVAKPLLDSSRRTLQSLPPEHHHRLGRALAEMLDSPLPAEGAPLGSPAPAPASAPSLVSAPEAAVAGAPAPAPSQASGSTMQLAGALAESFLSVAAPQLPAAAPGKAAAPLQAAAAAEEPGLDVVQVVMVQSIDAVAAGQHMIDGLLGLLRDTIHMTLSAAVEQARLAAPAPEVVVLEPMLVLDPPQAASYPDPYPHQPSAPEGALDIDPPHGSLAAAQPAWLADPFAEFLFGEEELEGGWDYSALVGGEAFFAGEEPGWGGMAAGELSMFGRRLQAHSPKEGAAEQGASDDDYSYDEEYEEEAWLDDYGWMLPQDQEELVAPLVVGLISTARPAAAAYPSGLPDALLEWMAQVAALLSEAPDALATNAPVEQSGSSAAPGLPAFAVFGPKSGHVAGNASNTTADAASPNSAGGLIAAVVVPLSGVARAPAVRAGTGPTASSFDAKWWGVSLSLAFVSVLLGAVAVVVVRRSSASQLGREDSYNHIPGVPPPTPAHHAPTQPQAASASAWEAAVRHKSAQQVLAGGAEARGAVAKKLSNLPA